MTHTVGKERGIYIGAPTLSRSHTTPANHGTASRSLSIGKGIEESAVTNGRGQLDFPDHASVHLEPPGYYIPLWGNNSALRFGSVRHRLNSPSETTHSSVRSILSHHHVRFSGHIEQRSDLPLSQINLRGFKCGYLTFCPKFRNFF